MEALATGVVIRGVGEFGILGLGWIMFLYATVELRLERKRYGELVAQMMTSMTKLRLVERIKDENPAYEALADLLGPLNAAGKPKRPAGRDTDSGDDEMPSPPPRRRRPASRRDGEEGDD